MGAAGVIVVCFVACAVLMLAEYRGSSTTAPTSHASTFGTLRIAAKIIASAAFVLVGVSAFGAGPFQNAMVLGLVFGAIGDVLLLGRSKRAFLFGLIAFLVGHVAYVVAFAQLESPRYWVIYGGRLGLLAIGGGLVALRWLWPNLGKLKVPVIVYVTAIVAMVLGALTIWNTGGLPAPERDYLALGACLFFVSDLAVARDKFVVRAVSNKLLGLPAYYTAQVLIACAIT